MEFAILELMGFKVNNVTAVEREHLSHVQVPSCRGPPWNALGRRRGKVLRGEPDSQS